MRRRGLTLIELVVYLGLVTTGMLLVGAVELLAQRSAAQQLAQLELEFQLGGVLSRLRADVEGARELTVAADGAELLVRRQDGREVRYQAGRRVERGGADPEREEAFPALRELRAEVGPGPGASRRASVTLRMRAGSGPDALEREVRAQACTRLEGTP